MTTLKKGSREYQIQKFDITIGELVYDKVAMRKAYNYYHGKMDMDQYKHFEDNYGIGTPTQIQFIPLMKKHIDYIVGKFLDSPLNMHVSCKDSKTLSNIQRDKQLKILSELKDLYMRNLYNHVLVKFGTQDNIIPIDPITEKQVQNLILDLDKNFISEYEIAVQNLINYISQSRSIDLDNKLRLLFTDLLVSGTLYFRGIPSPNNTNVELEDLDPLNTFVEKNPNSYYLNKSPRAVCRFFMTADQILARYGDELTAADKEKLYEDLEKTIYQPDQKYIVRSAGPVNAVDSSTEEYSGILGGLEVTPLWDGVNNVYSATNRRLTVYEVEYLEADKEGVMHRYSGVKIGADIYIVRERDWNVVRSMDNPKDCTISVNGIFLTTRKNFPFSMMLATADLQD